MPGIYKSQLAPFFMILISLPVESPKAFAAALTPFL